MKILTKKCVALAICSWLLAISNFAFAACEAERAALDYCMAHNFRAPDWCRTESVAHLECLANGGGNPTSWYDVPTYKPNHWNSEDLVRCNNNCYNYATNNMTGDFAQPGKASGSSTFTDTPDTCEGVVGGAVGDVGITKINSPGQVQSGETLMALFVRPIGTYGGILADYHWYRRDKNNKWSHKVGTRPASNVDQNGALITDPRYAARDRYDLFCGWFKTKSKMTSAQSHDQDKGQSNIKGYNGYVAVEGPTCTQVANGRIGGGGIIKGGTIEQSSVTLLQNSGLPDVEIALVELMDSDVYSQLQSSAYSTKYQQLARVPQMKNEQFIPSKLGYQGLLIKDREGIFFEKGSQVLVKGNMLKVVGSNNKSRFNKYSLSDKSLENELLDKLREKGYLGPNQ